MAAISEPNMNDGVVEGAIVVDVADAETRGALPRGPGAQ